MTVIREKPTSRYAKERRSLIKLTSLRPCIQHALLFGLSFLLWSSTATAQTGSLEQRFKQAQTLHDAGRCNAALPQFEELVAATQSPNARLYVARCLRQLGRLAEAYEQMRSTLKEARTAAGADQRYAATRNAAAAELALLEPLVGRLLIRLTERPNGMTLRLNGRLLSTAALTEPVPVAPGPFVLTAEAPGRAAHRVSGTTYGGALASLDVIWPTSATKPTTGDSPTFTMNSMRIGGFVVAGVGVAGVAAFAISGTMAKNEFDALEEACGGAPCSAAFADRIDRGRTLQTVANVSLAVGGAAMLAGTTMIIFGGTGTAEASTTALSLQPYPLGASLRGRF